jgi:hypothetical protein
MDGLVVPFRLPAFAVTLPDGTTAYVNKALGKRLAGAFRGAVVALTPAAGSEILHEVRTFKNEKVAAAELGLGKSLAVEAEKDLAGEVEDEDLELAATRDEELDLSGERKTFFGDPSRAIHGGRWIEAKVFWSMVRTEVIKRPRSMGRLHG